MVVGALVAAFLFAHSLAVLIVNVVDLLATPGLQDPGQVLPGAFEVRPLVLDLLGAAAFGVGVWVSLRWVAPVGMDVGWRKTVLRGVVATAVGSATGAVMSVIITFVLSTSPGAYPLGYSFSPTLNIDNAWEEIPNDVFSGVFSFVDCVTVVVLAVVLFKVWQTVQFNKLTAPSSVFAKL